ncbi:5-oxoprolinase subunit PxpB [Pontibacter akesuensis]|uniref:Inhibitor of KinA n=1 Tax=Pontibacter akesuensis TaxID=388950 RepID=A0A1I7GQ85_9BACT|nr:5-oxoprolinase subunit PxpB [Pontibacter akesuensis]GHA55602.1 kinase A inhibitor [Pontibacter akesuensis]SFU50605.1 inhibitor of KinA [Pontibacter akesuensis]
MPQEAIQKLPFQLCPLGDTAIVLQFGHTIDPGTHASIRAFSALLEEQPFEGLVEYVPAFTTITVYYDPWVISQKGKKDAYSEVVQQLQQLLFHLEEKETPAVQLVEVPVVYGGAYGPDLEAVAAHCGLSMGEVVDRHCSKEYLVHMIGFAPGFPYLGGMDKSIATPRKATPRQSIPAGSVGIAGEQTGVYPISTPGGWQLIGQTPVQLFNAKREMPSLLQAGDKVRFVPISEEEFLKRKEVAWA